MDFRNCPWLPSSHLVTVSAALLPHYILVILHNLLLEKMFLYFINYMLLLMWNFSETCKHRKQFSPLDVASIVPHNPGVKKAKCDRRTNLYSTLVAHFLYFKNCFARILENGEVIWHLFGADLASIKLPRNFCLRFLNNRSSFYKISILITIFSWFFHILRS